MLFIRQGATHKVVLGPFVDATDGFTPEVGITLSGADEAEVILHDNGTVVDISGYTWAAITTADGYYQLTLQSGISGTVGHMTVLVNDDNVCRPVKAEFTVLEEAVYDRDYKTSATGLDEATIADAVWDEGLTGSSHNIATSAGKRLRQIEEAFVHASGTIATVTNGHTFTLDSGAVATGDYYIGDRLQITEGTGAGQSRLIVGYTSGRVATLDSDYTTNPDTSSLYEIDAADVHVSVSDADLAEGFVAVYTNTTTITLDAAALATTDYYTGELIVFTHGTGAGQAREITGYTSGRVVTMSPDLTTALDTTTVYHIQAAVSIPEIVNEAWGAARSDHTTVGTFGHAFKGLEGSTAKAGTLSTTQMSTNLTEGTDNHYIGRTIVWLTGVLTRQASDITDYVAVNGVLTYTAVTEAPSADDEFVIY